LNGSPTATGRTQVCSYTKTNDGEWLQLFSTRTKTRARQHRKYVIAPVSGLNASNHRRGDEAAVQIGFDGFGATLAAVTGVLDTAERRFRQGQTDVVDRYHAGFHFITKPMGRFHGRREGIGRQAV